MSVDNPFMPEPERARQLLRENRVDWITLLESLREAPKEEDGPSRDFMVLDELTDDIFVVLYPIDAERATRLENDFGEMTLETWPATVDAWIAAIKELDDGRP